MLLAAIIRPCKRHGCVLCGRCHGQQPAALERATRMRANGAELGLPASHASDELAPAGRPQ